MLCLFMNNYDTFLICYIQKRSCKHKYLGIHSRVIKVNLVSFVILIIVHVSSRASSKIFMYGVDGGFTSNKNAENTYMMSFNVIFKRQW